ncbi:hypothetical protein [Aliidiomarina sp. B3213]|nr:hypothetical protein [Aliidiomarina sp. B3213]RTE87161.1 hypothetical protein DQX04_01855 [Aliidiomarina sp. B3213]
MAFIRVVGVSLIPLSLVACVSTEPEQRAPIADLRPTVAIIGAENPPEQVNIYVNNLLFGALSDYTEPQQPLRLLSGVQVLEIKHQGTSLYKQSLQLSPGEHRIINLGPVDILESIESETAEADSPLY